MRLEDIDGQPQRASAKIKLSGGGQMLLRPLRPDDAPMPGRYFLGAIARDGPGLGPASLRSADGQPALYRSPQRTYPANAGHRRWRGRRRDHRLIHRPLRCLRIRRQALSRARHAARWGIYCRCCGGWNGGAWRWWAECAVTIRGRSTSTRNSVSKRSGSSSRAMSSAST